MKQLPHIDPVLLKPRAEPFDDPEWFFELKYDGFRAVLYADGNICQFRSKTGKRLQFPELERALSGRLKGVRAILDGEICSLDRGGWPRFRSLIERTGDITYVAFDIMWLDEGDLRGIPLFERKDVLKRFLKRRDFLKMGYFVREKGKEFYDLAVKLDLEGIVAKKAISLYSQRAGWLKIKNPCYSLRSRGRYFDTKR